MRNSYKPFPAETSLSYFSKQEASKKTPIKIVKSFCQVGFQAFFRTCQGAASRIFFN
ncbi:hypothetical protein BH24BAC1_BH24BAC1_23830 [soil metagenome]